MTTSVSAPSWLEALDSELDLLEDALLGNAAPAVEAACQNIHALLRAAPRRAPAPATVEGMGLSAQRLARLQQAVIRSAARSQRAVDTLFPPAPSAAAYGAGTAAPGRGYHLSA